MIHIVINLIDTENFNVEDLLITNVTPAGELLINGKMAAVIWEAPTIEVATKQAEKLWDATIPARIVHNKEEEKRFVLQLVLQATPPSTES